MIRKSIILSLFFIAPCCGCENRDIGMVYPERKPVLLSVNETKTGRETSLEEMKVQGFRTFLYKNENEKLRDEIVTWSDGYFRFAEETLWPGDGESLSVYAVASPELTLNIEEIDGKPTIKLFSGTREWYNDFDICVARVEGVSGGGTINLPFKHILGKISGIYVKNLCQSPKNLLFYHVLFWEPAEPCYDIKNKLWRNNKIVERTKIEAPIKNWGKEYEPVKENMRTLYLLPGKKTVEVCYHIIDTVHEKFSHHKKKVSFNILPGNDYILKLTIHDEHVSVSCVSQDVQEWDSGEEISGQGL